MKSRRAQKIRRTPRRAHECPRPLGLRASAIITHASRTRPAITVSPAARHLCPARPRTQPTRVQQAEHTLSARTSQVAPAGQRDVEPRRGHQLLVLEPVEDHHLLVRENTNPTTPPSPASAGDARAALTSSGPRPIRRPASAGRARWGTGARPCPSLCRGKVEGLLQRLGSLHRTPAACESPLALAEERALENRVWAWGEVPWLGGGKVSQSETFGGLPESPEPRTSARPCRLGQPTGGVNDGGILPMPRAARGTRRGCGGAGPRGWVPGPQAWTAEASPSGLLPRHESPSRCLARGACGGGPSAGSGARYPERDSGDPGGSAVLGSPRRHCTTSVLRGSSMVGSRRCAGSAGWQGSRESLDPGVADLTWGGVAERSVDHTEERALLGAGEASS